MNNALLIIKLRLKQIFNALKNAGIIRLIFILTLFIIANLSVFNSINRIEYDKYITGGYLALILLLHLNRKDIFFLRITYFKHKYILLTEYFLLTIPLFVPLIYYHKWSLLLAGLIFISLITNIKLKTTQYTLNTKIQQLIPNISYEWKAGSRKYFFILSISYLLGLFTSFFLASVLLSIFILGLISLSFYEQPEPLQMIIAFEYPSQKFIFKKIKTHILLFSTLVFPLILIFSIFHPSQWYIPILEYIIFLSLHLFMILSKYAYYEANTSSAGNQIMQMIASIALFIPIFIPALWIVSVFIFLKAKTKLNFYLNDYN